MGRKCKGKCERNIQENGVERKMGDKDIGKWGGKENVKEIYRKMGWKGKWERNLQENGRDRYSVEKWAGKGQQM